MGIYYCDPLGRDWLDTQREFNAETLKVMFDEKGVIVSQTQDVSGFSPNGRWVAEVEADKVPDGFDINGGWQYLSGEIIPREYTQEELSAQAERQKRRLMEHAERTLAPLERAERLGIATDDEKNVYLHGLLTWCFSIALILLMPWELSGPIRHS